MMFLTPQQSFIMYVMFLIGFAYLNVGGFLIRLAFIDVVRSFCRMYPNDRFYDTVLMIAISFSWLNIAFWCTGIEPKLPGILAGYLVSFFHTVAEFVWETLWIG